VCFFGRKVPAVVEYIVKEAQASRIYLYLKFRSRTLYLPLLIHRTHEEVKKIHSTLRVYHDVQAGRPIRRHYDQSRSITTLRSARQDHIPTLPVKQRGTEMHE
jgi:hypothetical protein